MTAVLPAALRAAVSDDGQLPAVMQQLLIGLVQVLPGAASATVVTLRGAGLRPWAGTGATGHELDLLQARTHRGPAFDAAGSGGPVVSGHVLTDPRWQLAEADGAPARSVVAVALTGAAAWPAVLCVHGDGQGEDLTAPFVVEQILAAVPDLSAAVCLVRARLEVADLQIALTTNRTIGAAIGITMVVRRLSYEAAADLLRSVSNSTNVRLGDLAESVLFTGEVPDAPARMRNRRPMPPLDRLRQ